MFPQGTPVQLHSPAHVLDHGKMPPTQMALSWADQRKAGEQNSLLHFFQPSFIWSLTILLQLWLAHSWPVGLPLFYQKAGLLPVVKQEQLSPHSLSSQADNVSTQGAIHDAAAGRGASLTFSSFISFWYRKKIGIATWYWRILELIRLAGFVWNICCQSRCCARQVKSYVFPYVLQTVLSKIFLLNVTTKGSTVRTILEWLEDKSVNVLKWLRPDFWNGVEFTEAQIIWQ